MKIVSQVMKKQIFRAMLIGGIVGLFGVAIFLGILQASTQLSLKNDSNEVASSNNKDTDTETIPTAGGATKSPMFFASQAGVYSNYESASSFVSEHPSLKESAIVEVDGKFYVWTSMVTDESQLTFLEDPATFKKAFNVSSDSCKEATIAELPSVLADKKATKLNFKENSKDSTLPADWQSIGAAASSISNDVSIIRLQVFAHYKSKNACLQVKF
ncbi:hypothetical protein [Lysinibacillus pakistanensis]|uniref:Uncharacterized protein n=1 Tax=Lysinibacillus pakistanensis TaxID=759811 RepID=A0AAX3WR21_9BACI|nr:hypothetical protein [Lysinibacillus pakistanensis]MDM5229682.1 hypothetical protein [Lysinibacillus pakistanensis]WHY45292.1 hypothetical protein QNH22_18520 [Lysinibacillus pakistanensis]WHY50300.1 hypothetical protein QNH24_18485 [Lysinibacillus pakistanensis]